MKLARIALPDGPVWGALVQNGLDAAVPKFRRVEWRDGQPVAKADLLPQGKLLAPVDPTQIMAIGLNYRHHAEESGAKIPEFPVLFTKGLNTLIGPEDPIVLPRKLRSDKVDYEAELAFVIGRKAKNVARENAMDYVLGFTAANDVSARDWQREWGGSQWVKGKSFDTFCPVGPYLVTSDRLPNYGELRIATRVNGETLQDWNTNDMIFGIPALVEFLSGSTTLLPGTLVLTGTPHGVGMARTPPRWLVAGDVVEIEIEGVGVLRNPVVEEAG